MGLVDLQGKNNGTGNATAHQHARHAQFLEASDSSGNRVVLAERSRPHPSTNSTSTDRP
jgi:hypothetical protein